MNVLDTDVFSSYAYGVASIVAMISAQPADTLYVPIIAVEEVFRGRLAAIRKFDTVRQTDKRLQAYHHFLESYSTLSRFNILAHNAASENLALQWKQAKIKVGIQDMRIAAITIVNSATLITRNAREYAQIPSLKFVVWS